MNNNKLNDLLELKDKVKAWWDLVYPEDIFPKEIEGIDNEDRDEGVLRVVEIRELIKKIETPLPKGVKG